MNRLISLEIVKSFIESQDQFTVDFEEAYLWCGYSNKSNALRVLKANFIENTDYVFFINNDEKSKGRPQQEYRLTSDCFKEFAMLAQTEKGKQIRLYFLECEKLLKQQEKIKQMSPAELALLQAQNLLNLEKKVSEVENKLDSLIIDREEARQQLNILEEPKVIPLQKTERMKVNKVIRAYCTTWKIAYDEAWNTLFTEFNYRHHVNVQQRAENRKISKLDAVELLGKMPDLYAIAYEIFIKSKDLINVRK